MACPQKYREPQVAFLFVVLSLMSIFMSWIKQQDLAVVICTSRHRVREPNLETCVGNSRKTSIFLSTFKFSFPSGCGIQ